MAANGNLVMMLVGDNFFVDYEDIDTIYDYVLPAFQKADLLFGNLEMPITDRGERVIDKPPEDVVLRMHPKTVNAFMKAGFDVVSLANNHIMNFGPEGLFQTIDLLNKGKIAHAGAGRNINEAREPAIVQKNGCRVAFLCYTSVCVASFPATENRPGVVRIRVHTAYEPPQRVLELPGAPPIVITRLEPEDVQLVREDIGKARTQADIVVVSWHWGVSFEQKILDYQKEGGHVCIDAGADLVIGHHAHGLQGIEVYKGKVIAFGLGNFTAYFPVPRYLSRLDKKSIILKCDIVDKKIRRASFLPSLMNERWQTEVVSGAKAEPIISMMQKLCSELGTNLKPNEGEVEIIP
jgi:poly-gamma-glutamate capsule biosynthesis protein CapA/YwtB (metallophosphatase superfamily)